MKTTVYVILNAYSDVDVDLATTPQIFASKAKRDKVFKQHISRIEEKIRDTFGDSEKLPEDLDEYYGDSFYYNRGENEIFYKSYEMDNQDIELIRKFDIPIELETKEAVIWDYSKKSEGDEV